MCSHMSSSLNYVKFLSVNIENYIYLDLHSYRLESFLKTANAAVINNSLTFHKRISKTIDLPFSVGSKNDSQFNNDHLPFCCQDAVGNFSETSRISVSHWTFRLDLCAFLANNFVRASEYAMLLSTVTLKSLTGIIIPFFVLFFRSKISHARSLKNFVTRNNVVVDQRSFFNRWTKKKSVLWSLERLVDFVFCCLRSLFFED